MHLLDKEQLKLRIDMAAGRELPELVLRNCRIVNVFSEEIIDGDIAIHDGIIVGIGSYRGRHERDLAGAFVAPGLIDGHVHIESAMVTPGQFAKAVIPHGTTTIIADPHEIANVCGLAGIEYMLGQSAYIPLDVYLMMPSCVPATPFENAGAVLMAQDMEKMLLDPRILGLGEFMDYPGVVSARADVLDKIAVGQGKLIDGHGPALSGKSLNAYVAAGIHTEHECTTEDEMLERLRLGMYIQIREGSAARNLETLIRKVAPQNMRRVLFCTDDRHPGDILREGHIDNNVRTAIRKGMAPISAIRIATLNAAECYRLYDKGAVAPGYQADLIVFDTLESFTIDQVFKSGKLVAQKGKALFDVVEMSGENVRHTVNLPPVETQQLELKLSADIANVIRLLPHSLVTERVIRKVELKDGSFICNEKLDILKLAVIERHKATGNIGLGLIENFRLRKGALASTVAHDSHNLIVTGTNDTDMLVAIAEIQRMGGGLAIACEGAVVKSLPLPIAGLMSDKPLIELDAELRDLIETAYGMGVNPALDPFMTLAFLALPVIPELKLTDMGLFDVTGFDFLGINEMEAPQ